MPSNVPSFDGQMPRLRAIENSGSSGGSGYDARLELVYQDVGGSEQTKPIPLVLAGPVLRRVSPDSVTVWVALSEAASVTLRVTQSGALEGTETVTPVAVGDNLHVAAVTAEGLSLSAGTMYSYELHFDKDGWDDTWTLDTDGVVTYSSQGANSGHRALHPTSKPQPPSFALPPRDKNDLRVFHASCRKPHGEKRDALPAVHRALVQDDAYQKPNERPHLLMLTGDQIYADDVADHLFAMIWNHARGLVGDVDEEGNPERIPDGDGSLTSLGDYRPDHRQKPAWEGANLSAGAPKSSHKYASSHLFGLSEYVTMYLCSWSDALWPPEEAVRKDANPNEPAGAFPSLKRVWSKPEASDTSDPSNIPDHVLYDVENFYNRKDEKVPPVSEFPESNYKPRDGEPEGDSLPNFIELTYDQVTWSDLRRNQDIENKGDMTPVARNVVYDFIKEYRTNRKDVYWFRKALPKVRKILANVPTMMMWDDHDVTDDWFVSGTWCEEVLGSPMGHRVVQNGMVAAVLCQMWGNSPDRYESGSGKTLLEMVDGNVSDKSTFVGTDPSSSTSKKVDEILGIPRYESGLEDVYSRSDWNRPPQSAPGDAPDRLNYHFGLYPGEYRFAAFDIRTWRAFMGPEAPPEVISPLGQKYQLGDIVADTAPWFGSAGWADRDVPTFVVSGVPLFTPMVVDTGQEYGRYVKRERSKAAAEVVAHAVPQKDGEMAHENAYADYEHWRLQRGAMENFLDLLAQVSKYVVTLSGDVHYGYTATSEYWHNFDGDGATPYSARIATLVASAGKNEIALTNMMHGNGYTFRDAAATVGWYHSDAPSDLQALQQRESDIESLLGIKAALGTDLSLTKAAIIKGMTQLKEKFVVEPLDENKVRGNPEAAKLRDRKYTQAVAEFWENSLDRIGFLNTHEQTSPTSENWTEDRETVSITHDYFLHGLRMDLSGLINAGSIYLAREGDLSKDWGTIPIPWINDWNMGFPPVKRQKLGDVRFVNVGGQLSIKPERLQAQQAYQQLRATGWHKTVNGYILDPAVSKLQSISNAVGSNVTVSDEAKKLEYYAQVVEDFENEGLEIRLWGSPSTDDDIVAHELVPWWDGTNSSSASGSADKSVAPWLWREFRDRLDQARSFKVWKESVNVAKSSKQKIESVMDRWYQKMRKEFGDEDSITIFDLIDYEQKGFLPHWEYRTEYLQGYKPFVLDPPDRQLSDTASKRIAHVFDDQRKDVDTFAKSDASRWPGDEQDIGQEVKDYNTAPDYGSEIVGHNNVGEVRLQFQTHGLDAYFQDEIANNDPYPGEVAKKTVTHTLWWRLFGTEQIRPYTVYTADLRENAKGVPVRNKQQSGGPTDIIEFSARPSKIMQHTYNRDDVEGSFGPTGRS